MKEFDGKNIIIMFCSKCNLKCNHCYIEYKGNLNCPQLTNLINSLKYKYNISINGSEPLINEEYLDVFKLIGQDRVLTNGIILHNNYSLINRLVDSGIKWVGMSYHFSLHEKLSLVDKQIIEDNILELKKHNISVEIMTTVSKLNYKEVESMVIEAIRMGASCIRFTNLFNEGRTINMTDLLLSEEEINEFFNQFYYVKQKYEDYILVRRSGTFNRDMRKINSSFFCPSIIETVAIAPNYKVYPCPFLIKEGYEIGYVEDGKVFIDEIYEHGTDTCLLHDVLNKQITYQKRRV